MRSGQSLVKCHGIVPSTSCSQSTPAARKPMPPRSLQVHRLLSPQELPSSPGEPMPQPGLPTPTRHEPGPFLRGESWSSGEVDNLPAWRRVQRRGRRRTYRGAPGPSSFPQPLSPSRSALRSSAGSGFRSCSRRHFESRPVLLQGRGPMTQTAPASERSLGESAAPGWAGGCRGLGRGGLRVRIGAERVHTRGPVGPIMECVCLIERVLRLGAESREGVVRARLRARARAPEAALCQFCPSASPCLRRAPLGLFAWVVWFPCVCVVCLMRFVRICRNC